MEKKGWIRSIRLKNRGIVAIILLFVVTAIIGICGMYYTLLESARILGRDLVRSYIQDEELNISKFCNQISLGMMYLEEMNDRHAQEDEKEEWVRDYFYKLKEALPSKGVEAYAVVGGKLIAETPWDGMEEYDYRQSEWYRKATAAEGAVIFTDAYQGQAKEEWVVSIAAVEPKSQDAIILDLCKETFQAFHDHQSLPEDGDYYLCDAKGQLLYSNTHFQVMEQELEVFARRLCETVRSGDVTEQNNDIVGVNGEKRGVYYSWVHNGWFCAMTMTYDALLQGMRSIFGWYIAVFCLFFVTASAMGYKNRQLLLAVKKEREITQSLGNSYYAFYRVNVKRNTYEIIKGSEYINAKLPVHGEYTDLLNTLAGIMDVESGQEFLKSFSLEKVKALISQRTEGFGGDFLRRFGDEYRWVNVSLLSDKTLGVDEGVLCFRKIHEEKQNQREYQKLLEDVLASAEMSEKSQRKFFASMSHEMKTPLNIIIGMADMAQRREAEKEKVGDCLNKIKASAQQLAGLINDILEDSRLDKGSMELEQRLFTVEEAVLDSTEEFYERAEREGKVFEVEMEISNRLVAGDPLYLIQILNQLLLNAMKYTNTGDKIMLKVRQSDEGEKLRYLFVIEDTGIGISKDFLPRLFEPYATEKRFEEQKRRKGLGLAIVKNLVTQMGGAISVESVLGEGSRFYVTIPFTAKDLEKEEVISNASERKDSVSRGLMADEGREENEIGTKLAGCKILLAEDNELNMEIAVELLTMAGAEVVCAVNGREAVEYFEKSAFGYFDAVVLDMQMPIMDGCAAAEAIRKMERPDASVIPIAALTANTLAEDVARTAHAGMDVHLAKPVVAENLWNTLYNLIVTSKKGSGNKF